MHSFDATFHRLLAELIEEQEKLNIRAMTEHRLKTFEDYQYRVGLLHGLQTAMTLCDEVEKRLAGST